MSYVECTRCSGTGYVCRSCDKVRSGGVPHQKCAKRPLRCPPEVHFESYYQCDVCGARCGFVEGIDVEFFTVGEEHLQLCSPCNEVAVREAKNAMLVILDRLLECRTGRNDGTCEREEAGEGGEGERPTEQAGAA